MQDGEGKERAAYHAHTLHTHARLYAMHAQHCPALASCHCRPFIRTSYIVHDSQGPSLVCCVRNTRTLWGGCVFGAGVGVGGRGRGREDLGTAAGDGDGRR